MIQRPSVWFQLGTVFPTDFFGDGQGQVQCRVSLGLRDCCEVFQPFCRHIFFSSPFRRMLLRSKNSKSTAPLTLISMPRCVLCCQGFSASFLQAARPLSGPLWLPLSPTRAPLVALTVVCFSLSACRLSGEMQLQWVWVWVLKSILILGRLGAFPGMSEKLRSGRSGEKNMGPILCA